MTSRQKSPSLFDQPGAPPPARFRAKQGVHVKASGARGAFDGTIIDDPTPKGSRLLYRVRNGRTGGVHLVSEDDLEG